MGEGVFGGRRMGRVKGSRLRIWPGAQIYDKCSYNLEKKKYLHI